MNSKIKQTIKKELQNNMALQICADQFGVIGDKTRMQICWLLCRHPELSVGEIGDLLEMEQSAVSHALRKLKNAGVVSDRRDAKRRLYSLNDLPICSYLKKQVL